jgi:hypothetical protein
MNNRFRMKRQFAGAVVALTLALGGCAPMTPKSAGYFVPPLGSTWIMLRSDNGSFGSTTSQIANKRGEQTWQGQKLTTLEAPGFSQLLNDKGAIVAMMSGDKPLASFDPPLGFAYPLEVGKSLSSTHNVTIFPSMKITPLQVTQKVEAYEDVTLPAGTFKAFKISWSESNGNENTYWVSPELGISVKSILVRTAKWSTGEGRRENQLVSQNISK